MRIFQGGSQDPIANINLEHSNQMIMYVGKKYAPGGYLWIFPKGKGFANIGLGISGDYFKDTSAQECLDKFIEREYPDVSILTTVCGGVPCPKPMRNPIADGLLLVGDAAHQINPMTGGGMASGMRGGQIAGEVAIKALKNKNFTKEYLQAYPKKIFKVFGNNHDRYFRIKETIHKLSDDDLNYIADRTSIIPESERALASIFKQAVYKKPSLLIDVLRVFAGV